MQHGFGHLQLGAGDALIGANAGSSILLVLHEKRRKALFVLRPRERANSSPAEPRMPAAHRLFALASLVVALVASLAYGFGLPGMFVFDDIPNIVNNDSIHLTRLDARALLDVLATPQVSGAMRGLPTLSFALDYWRAGGADPASFRITNIVIHALTACALAWLFRALLLTVGTNGRKAGSLACVLALAWALHPLQVSAVLYVVQRLQTMGTLFLVLALLAYLQARRAQMQGVPGRTGLLACALLWVLALGCKEDSALLPAYTLALELTVLRFAAADARVAQALRRGYLMAVLAGAVAYAFWAVPHYWQWDAYPGRDFSTWERLLTQPRVLCMYLWEILLPLPRHMPFFYDWVQPSRGGLQPWTTLPALAVVLGLLMLAWRLRLRRPLFALGVFLFFGAHFITSNVVGLELAFEHRNHFALIGVVLAAGSLLAEAGQRLSLRPLVQASVCAALLAALGSATAMRAHDWRSNVSLARASTQAAPGSARAWIELCDAYFNAGGGVRVRPNPHLDDAIRACASGVDAAPGSLNNLVLLTVLKTVRGDVSAQDWARLQARLKTARMSWDNARAPLILTYYAGLGVPLDRQQVLQALATLDRRTTLGPSRLAYIGDSLMKAWSEPELAMPYYLRAIALAPPGDPFADELASELRDKGRPDLAREIERAGRSANPSISSTPPSP